MMRGLLPAILLACGTALLPALAASPRPGEAVLAVFPPWVDAAGALARLEATPGDWRLLRVAAQSPLAALVLVGEAAEAGTLRRHAGLWFAIGVPAGGCLPPSARTPS